MKKRNGFVSNSSSSSFILELEATEANIALVNDVIQKAIVTVGKEQYRQHHSDPRIFKDTSISSDHYGDDRLSYNDSNDHIVIHLDENDPLDPLIEEAFPKHKRAFYG